MKKQFLKNMILAFEVIVQPCVNTFFHCTIFQILEDCGIPSFIPGRKGKLSAMSIDKTHRIYVRRLEYAHQSLMVAIKIRSDNLTRMRMRGERIQSVPKKIYMCCLRPNMCNCLVFLPNYFFLSLEQGTEIALQRRSQKQVMFL